MLLNQELHGRLRAIGATPRDDVLHLPAADGQPARELRVADGRVFGRTAAPSGRFEEGDWRELDVAALLGYFVEDSPVASWLRASGADLLQVAMISLGRP